MHHRSVLISKIDDTDQLVLRICVACTLFIFFAEHQVLSIEEFNFESESIVVSVL